MGKYIMLFIMCLLVAVPCVAWEEGEGKFKTMDEIYDEVYEEDRRIRERQLYNIEMDRERDRQLREFERGYYSDDYMDRFEAPCCDDGERRNDDGWDY